MELPTALGRNVIGPVVACCMVVLVSLVMFSTMNGRMCKPLCTTVASPSDTVAFICAFAEC